MTFSIQQQDDVLENGGQRFPLRPTLPASSFSGFDLDTVKEALEKAFENK